MNIILENITKEYNTGFGQNVIALKDINISLNSGDAVSVIGPSGAGKSTLLHIIGLMDTPSSGNVVFDGINTSAMNSVQKATIRKSKLGFLFQFHHLLPEFTVLENILLPSWESRAEKLSTAMNLLKVLGIENRSQHLPTQLSGGEAQRVKLATELAKTGNGHTVYILDEPTTGLHFEDLNKLVQTLTDLVGAGNTVIVIEHNLDVIKNADYLIDMGPEGGDNGGEIIATGTPKQLADRYDTPTSKELKKLSF